MTNPGPGWHRDPSGHHEHRYWNGDAWTEHVANGGASSTDGPSGTTEVPHAEPGSVPSRRRRLAIVGAFTAASIVAVIAVVVLLVWNGGDDAPVAAPDPDPALGSEAAPDGQDGAVDAPALDELHDQCADGDFQACDELYLAADPGSAHETFGSTCGDRNEPSDYCERLHGVEVPDDGGDPLADTLIDGCAEGDMFSCDELYDERLPDPQGEVFALTCGGRRERSTTSCSELTGEAAGGEPA